MGLFLYFVKNEYVEINTPKGLVKVIVRDIHGEPEKQEVDLEIRNGPITRKMHLSYCDRFKKIAYGISIGLKYKFKEGEFPEPGKVSLNFRTPYKISGKRYRLK